MKALISGITGQDGSYLAELLLEKGYEVHGIIRRSSSLNTGRIDHIFNQLHLHYGDLTDSSSLISILSNVEPDEVYNLGAQSQVRTSFDIPEYTADTNAMGTLRLLDAIRFNSRAKFYQASTSEMYGKVLEIPKNEYTPFNPRSPYGISKEFAYRTVVDYREAYGMFACNGILFNHESPRRGETFVSKKIVKAAINIFRGKQDKLFLGNLDAKRDWGYAKEYVEAMWLMMQRSEADDFVIATGETHTVRDFLDVAFSFVGLNWSKYVEIDLRYFRPTEVDLLQGDASKAKKILGWEPKTRFRDLVFLMMGAEFENRS